MRNILTILLFVLALTSCGIMRIDKTSDFSTIKNTKDLEGEYLNLANDKPLLLRFNIRDIANFISITSVDSSKIKLSYYNDSTKQEHIFTGQMKDNFFEIYFSNERVTIPIIYSSCSIERIRIGKSKNGELLIREFLCQGGNVLFLAGGYSVEKPYSFKDIKEFKGYKPFHENGIWGYNDTLGNIVVPPKYDFACLFDLGIARVKINDKWGLINDKGEEISPIKYDHISIIDTKLDPPIFRATIGEKVGVIDIEGNETIPVIYDFLAYSNMSQNGLFRIKLGDKVGFASRTHVVIPAIYSRIVNFNGSTAVAVRNEQYFIVDKNGYEYETNGFGLINRTPRPNTKRKIQFEEQKSD
jgi:hypothetical protein